MRRKRERGECRGEEREGEGEEKREGKREKVVAHFARFTKCQAGISHIFC